LATLWVVRYLFQLGRETGEARHLTRAIEILDSLLDHMGPLGMLPMVTSRASDPLGRPAAGVWGLHSMMIEAMLDLAGFDFDAGARAFYLEPILPPEWPSVGLEHAFSCGDAKYRLERVDGDGAGYRLEVEATIDGPAELRADLTCPELARLTRWEGPSPRAEFDAKTRRLRWRSGMPGGASRQVWTWG
jgi:hypothetical protein